MDEFNYQKVKYYEAYQAVVAMVCLAAYLPSNLESAVLADAITSRLTEKRYGDYVAVVEDMPFIASHTAKLGNDTQWTTSSEMVPNPLPEEIDPSILSDPNKPALQKYLDQYVRATGREIHRFRTHLVALFAPVEKWRPLIHVREYIMARIRKIGVKDVLG